MRCASARIRPTLGRARPTRQGEVGMSSSRDFEGRLHPKAKEAFELMERGRLSRRDFIRIAALTGVSAGAAYAMAGLPAPALRRTGTIPFVDDPNAKKGGILRVAMQVQKMEDPATFRLDAEVQPGAPDHRIHGLHRPEQRHPSDADGELGGLRRPEDLDAASAPGREVAQRRRFQRRRRDLQLHPLDGSGRRLVECRPLDLLRHDRGSRFRREERRRHGEDGRSR